MKSFTSYVNIKNICAAIYANAGVLISSLIFLFADRSLLELGKVFSTLALLGYVFNFSIVYSNYAIEALYQLKVFNQRITEVIEKTFEKENLAQSQMEAVYTETGDANRAHLELDTVYSQWNVHEDRDTGEDIENESDQ